MRLQPAPSPPERYSRRTSGDGWRRSRQRVRWCQRQPAGPQDNVAGVGVVPTVNGNPGESWRSSPMRVPVTREWRRGPDRGHRTNNTSAPAGRPARSMRSPAERYGPAERLCLWATPRSCGHRRRGRDSTGLNCCPLLHNGALPCPSTEALICDVTQRGWSRGRIFYVRNVEVGGSSPLTSTIFVTARDADVGAVWSGLSVGSVGRPPRMR